MRRIVLTVTLDPTQDGVLETCESYGMAIHEFLQGDLINELEGCGIVAEVELTSVREVEEAAQ